MRNQAMALALCAALSSACAAAAQEGAPASPVAQAPSAPTSTDETIALVAPEPGPLLDSCSVTFDIRPDGSVDEGSIVADCGLTEHVERATRVVARWRYSPKAEGRQDVRATLEFRQYTGLDSP